MKPKKKCDTLRNGSGYVDKTAYEAIKNAEEPTVEETDRFHKLLNTIFYIVELADFEIEGRIVLKDKKTDRVWR